MGDFLTTRITCCQISKFCTEPQSGLVLCVGSHAVVWRSLAGISVLIFHYGAAMASGVTRVIHRCEEAEESGYLGK
jgi:hypothetical protein